MTYKLYVLSYKDITIFDVIFDDEVLCLRTKEPEREAMKALLDRGITKGRASFFNEKTKVNYLNYDIESYSKYNIKR